MTWFLSTKGRIPLFLKYVISTSVFKLLLTVKVFPDDSYIFTYWLGTMFSGSSKMFTFYVPSIPKDFADSSLMKVNGKIPMPTRLLLWIRSKL